MRVRVSELALSVVTCQPLIVAAVNIYTSSLSAAPPSYNKMSRGAGVPVTRHRMRRSEDNDWSCLEILQL